MKSGKQRKSEIKKRRSDRKEERDWGIDSFKGPIPDWAIPVNPNEVVYHSAFAAIPLFYIDKEFTCVDCRQDQTWTAQQQKRWYEVIKGKLETTAVRCRDCRDKRKSSRDDHQRHMEEVARKTHHPHESFFNKKY